MFSSIYWMILNLGSASSNEEAGQKTETWTGYSTAVYLFLPVAGLAFVLGKKDIFQKLLLQIDRNCVSVFCPSFSQREKLIKWAGSCLPVTWSSHSKTLSGGVQDLWNDGSLLCTLLNSAIPGACPNPHRHWKKPPLHAQAIAYKYLGVIPNFTDNDLCGEFNLHQERNFIQYLNKLKQAVNKFTSNKNELNQIYSSKYVARGMGLFTGEQYTKTIFYIYSNSSTNCNREDILVQIRGPYGTFGTTTIPFQLFNTSLPQFQLNNEKIENDSVKPKKKSFLRTMSKEISSYILPDKRTQTDVIEVSIEMEKTRAKIVYVPKNFGMYEITLVSNNEFLRGSPYNVHIIKNTTEIEENENNEFMNKEQNEIGNKIIDNRFSNDSESLDIDKLENQNNYEKSTDEKVNKQISKIIEECKQDDTQNEEERVLNPNIKIENNISNVKSLKELNNSTNVDNKNKLENTENEESINKIQIPATLNVNETYGVNKQKIAVNVNSKYFKNAINNSNKKSTSSSVDIYYDKDLCNMNNTQSYQKIEQDVEINNLKHIPTRFFQPTNTCPEQTIRINPSLNTSPICPDHIVPEVKKKINFTKLSSVEKRQIFSATNQKVSFISSQNSSFSGSENVSSVLKIQNNLTESLSVLNVLDSLKQTDKSPNFALNSTLSSVSLPNMSSLDSMDSNCQDIFQEKKHFWEKWSSSSNSSMSSTDDNKNINLEQNFKFWKKPSINDKNLEIHKSADDILTIGNALTSLTMKSKSLDDSLDECSSLSIKERKKLLLKQNYEKEEYLQKEAQKDLKYKSIDIKSNNDKNIIDINQNDTVIFSSISERIKQFDKNKENLKLIKLNPEVKKIAPNIADNTLASASEVKINELSTFVDKHKKSHFKRAVQYFKNLEAIQKKTVNPKPAPKPKLDSALTRRYSFDLQMHKNEPKKKAGGSLNLSNISQRFSINNLYNDIRTFNKSKFRGIPNKDAVVKSLSKLSSKDDVSNDLEDNDKHTSIIDDIKYNLFTGSSKKNKERRSLKSVFDVHY